MDPESRKLLEDTLELAKENNRILHSLKRSMQFSRWVSIVYWVLIIGSAIGAFYFVQPYIDSLVKTYGSASSFWKNF